MMQEKFPGALSEKILALFARGEAMDSQGFIGFFSDQPLYQFGNAAICYDKASIKTSVDQFFSAINALYHDIKMMWEIGNVAFVEMDVMYWRKDGSMVRLPCFDIFRMEGDKFTELRIFMDANPLGNPSLLVPESASVFYSTSTSGEALSPVMRNYFTRNEEGIKRINKGFIPRWLITGPEWEIQPGAQFIQSRVAENI